MSHKNAPALPKNKVSFPGAVAKVPQVASAVASQNLDGDEHREDSCAFVPALDDEASVIIEMSEEIPVNEDSHSGQSDGANDAGSGDVFGEGAAVAPEPVLDWKSLERKQGEGEDDCLTVSSASVESIEAVASDAETGLEGDTELGALSEAEPVKADKAELEMADTAEPEMTSEAEPTMSGEAKQGISGEDGQHKAPILEDLSLSREGGIDKDSSQTEPAERRFPGAVASPGEHKTIEPDIVLEPWWKQIPTWQRTVTFSTIILVVAGCILLASLSLFRTAPNSEETGLDIVSEVLSSVLNRGNSERVFQGKDRLNILCLGIDYNRDERGMGYTAGARSDTIFVLSLNPDGSILNVLSVPRDTYVYIGHGVGYDKINSAYSVGGIDLAKEVVSNFLGIPIHKYIIIKVAGAYKMVDALGGLQINVEKDMDYDDNWGQLHIHLRAGNQLLKGEEAVGYARFRMDEESDRGRIRRQQQTMQALLQRLKDPAVILRLQAIIKAVKENVLTDLSMLDMLDLAYLYKDFDRQRMKTGTLVGDDSEINGVSVIIPYELENRKIVAELFTDNNNIQRGDVRVQVLNGCGDAGLANEVAQLLTREGFQVTQGEADRKDYEITRVIDHLGNVSMCTAVVNLIRGCQCETYEQNKNLRDCEITVIVGSDRRQPLRSSSPQSYETIIIDNGSDTPEGYVDNGEGLSNENNSMPFSGDYEYEAAGAGNEAPSDYNNQTHAASTYAEPVSEAPAQVAEPAPALPAETTYEAPAPEPEPAVESAPEPEPSQATDTEDVLPAPVAL